MDEIIYLNGSLVPIDQANISALDYGFLYGYGLFETMRSYAGNIFLLDRHLERLSCAAKTIGISLKELNIKEGVMETLKVNKLGDARIRITVSAGRGTIVPNPDSCTEPTVLIFATHLQSYSEQVYNRGYKAIISNIRRNSQSFLSSVKSANYLESIIAKQEAKRAGMDEALFLNDRGLLAEASMSNIFLVKNNLLRTPSISNGILPGITRETVLQLASKLRIRANEDDIELAELLQSQEAFLTNSLIEIMPLVSVADKIINTGKPGSTTMKLLHAYHELATKPWGGYSD